MNNIGITVRGVIDHQGQILLVKHKETYDYWALPGGHLEPTDTLASGLIRELHEEFDVTASVGELLFIHDFYRTDRQMKYLDFFFHVTNGADFSSADLNNGVDSHEWHAAAWVDPAVFDETILPKFLSAPLADILASRAILKSSAN